MNLVLPSVLLLGGLGFACALILVIAAKIMFVPEDDRVAEILAALPGANCGACGFAGCSEYATAVSSGNASPHLCLPGGEASAAKIGEILGETVSVGEKKVAVVACRGNYDSTHDKYTYNGLESCAACSMFHSGRGDCSFGCLGYGDCAATCPFDAISVHNGVASVNYSRCTGCGMCVPRCPKRIIKLVPYGKHPFVLCSNHDKGSLTRKVCVSGCLGCKKCEQTCPTGAITVQDNCATVDFSLCSSCGMCEKVCPVHAPSTEN